MTSTTVRRTVYLSHRLDTDTPMYADEGRFTRETLKCIEHGNTANLERWSLNNHSGTHMDFPRHFFSDAAGLDEFTPDFFMAGEIKWLDLSADCQPRQLIDAARLAQFSLPHATEVLLLKTGHERYRGKKTYWFDNPGYSDDLVAYLRGKCPHLRIFGFDSISLTSYQDRELGKKAHRAFLGAHNPILIIEDMKLSVLESGCGIRRLTIAPLLVANADGSPVTVIAEVEASARKNPEA